MRIARVAVADQPHGPLVRLRRAQFIEKSVHDLFGVRLVPSEGFRAAGADDLVRITQAVEQGRKRGAADRRKTFQGFFTKRRINV